MSTDAKPETKDEIYGLAVEASRGFVIPPDHIVASLTNPRKSFDKTALEELTESVRKRGLLQPVLVRPWPASRKPPKDFPEAPETGFELVVGERRWRAARAAKLAEIPVIVQELSDAEALEIQVVENLQRTDLHPLEEAEGYEQLQKLHGYSVEELAAKVGKSKAYVYARLKLTALVPAARKAFYADKLNPSTALLIARIPDTKLQEEAVRGITAPHWQTNESMSFRQAAEYVHRQFMLRLKDAPFSVADVQLVPEAGACTTCPKRTGNQRELFDDVKSADVCTDPPCFQRKRDAAWKQRSAEAAAAGVRVLSEKEAKRTLQHGGKAKLASLDQGCSDDPNYRSFRKIVGKDAPPVVAIAQDPRTGSPVELVDAKELEKATRARLKKKGVSPTPSRSTSVADRARQKAARRETAVRRRIFDAIRAKHPGKLSLAELQLVAHAFFKDIWDEHRKRVFDLWGWEGYGRTEDAGKKKIATLKQRDVCRFLLSLALIGEVQASQWGTKKPTRLLEVARQYRVDVARIRKEVLADEATKKKGAKKKPARRMAPKKKAKLPPSRRGFVRG